MRGQKLLKYILQVALVVPALTGTCTMLWAQGGYYATQQQQYRPNQYQQTQPNQYQQTQQQPQQKKPGFFSRIFGGGDGGGNNDDNKPVPTQPANANLPQNYYDEPPVIGAPQTGQQVAPPRPQQSSGASYSSASPRMSTSSPSSPRMTSTTIQPRSSDEPSGSASTSARRNSPSSSSSGDGSIYSKLKGYRNEDTGSTPAAARYSDDDSGLPSPPRESRTYADGNDGTSSSRRTASPSGTLSAARSIDSGDNSGSYASSGPSSRSSSSGASGGLPKMSPNEEYSNYSSRSAPSNDRAGAMMNEENNNEPSSSKRNLFGMRKSSSSEEARIASAAPQQSSAQEMPQVQTPSGPRAALEVIPTGPKNVFVNQEANYEFRVMNNSAVPADEVQVNIDIPAWVEIAQPSEVSIGSAALNPVSADMNNFSWKVGRLKPRQSATLVLRIIPREARPLNLVPRYEIQQVSANVANIEVQQPNIDMNFEGPSEANWGVEEKYTLRIRNRGNGDAKGLKLVITASGSDSVTPTIDMLKAGEEIFYELKLSPQISGDLQIHVQATGPYGLSAEAHKQVIIRRAELETVVEGPGFQFVGNPMEYYITTRNRGTATAHDVEIVAILPSGTKYISHSDDGHAIQGRNEIVWKVDSMAPGQEYSCAVLCEAKSEGEAVLEANVVADSGVHSSGSATTTVEAIADVVVRIDQPSNPVPVGSEGEYQVTITNRGTKTAQGIDATAYFSQGLSPIGVSGINAQMDTGAVYMEHIPSLGPNQSASCKIKAMAQVEGNHKIRVTMSCQSTGTNVSAEETKYFYQRRNGGLRNSGESQRDYVPQNMPNENTSSAPYQQQSPAPMSSPNRGALVAAPPFSGNASVQGTLTMPPDANFQQQRPNPQSIQMSPSNPGSLQTPPAHLPSSPY